MSYAELQVTSNFSFLRGASHPEELIGRASKLGLKAIAITDHHTLAGVVRAHRAAKELGLQYIVGCRLELFLSPDPTADKDRRGNLISILVYPLNRAAYGKLCKLLTLGMRRIPKGQCFLTLNDYLDCHQEFVSILVPPPIGGDSHCSLGQFAKACTIIKQNLSDGNLLSIAVTNNYNHLNRQSIQATLHISRTLKIPVAATNDVYYHSPERRTLQDVLTCIRNKCTIKQAGFRLWQNAEHHLKSPAEMQHLFRTIPEAVKRTIEISDMLAGFSLDELKYEYPNEITPPGANPLQYLSQLTWQGAREKYPQGIPPKVKRLISEELALIHELRYEKYFLTCYDIVKFARQRGILCQGRGAAANSAVCFCLGITSVDPDKIDLLLARFISKERNEPPDIDIDFEHERREEVIQYIYEKYGRQRAALTAEVITYRQRSAIRDVGKALGLPLKTVDKLAKSLQRWTGSNTEISAANLLGLEISPQSSLIQNTLKLSAELCGFPRHLSQHVGGFIISEKPLCETVPILNAAMPNRTTIEWDKDDIEALGILKIDILGLGILTCIRKTLEMVNKRHGLENQAALKLHTIPAEDPAVYDMICAADTVGVFQIESRAQMSMLPRLKPRCFYDLVIEIAVVRPGPIQGNMVHPYLKRREGLERATYPDQRVADILGKTLGIPLFQEQAMRLAIVLADFTPEEAEKLRRTMAACKKDRDKIAALKKRIKQGLLSNGYSADFAQTCAEQIQAFSEYGFPESHAASFALLVYASAWLKKYYPAEFTAALLNSQPMGFYAPAQIIRDAISHGVKAEKIDLNKSFWETEPCTTGICLGMHLIKGLSRAQAEIIIQAVKKHGSFASIKELWNTTRHLGLQRATLEILARADAFNSMCLNSRQALWEIKALPKKPAPLDEFETVDSPAEELLPLLTTAESMFQDYAAMGFSLRAHPLGLLRDYLQKLKVETALTLKRNHHSPSWVAVAGMVLFRQRPDTAKGMMFITLEDETGILNLIVRPKIFNKFKSTILNSTCLLAHGTLERLKDVIYITANHIQSLDREVLSLKTSAL